MIHLRAHTHLPGPRANQLRVSIHIERDAAGSEDASTGFSGGLPEPIRGRVSGRRQPGSQSAASLLLCGCGWGASTWHRFTMNRRNPELTLIAVGTEISACVCVSLCPKVRVGS